MSDPAAILRMTAAEYLAWEREQTSKHEYHRGEIIARVASGLRHNFLSTAIGAELRTALRGKPCHVLTSDQRISAVQGERYVYADAVVACGGVRLEPGTSDVLTNPMIIVEVLSPSTEKFDRGDKWGAYQRIASLTDYLLVAQVAARIEHYQRQSDGSWRYLLHEPGSSIVLSNGARLSVDDIYAGAFDLDAEG